MAGSLAGFARVSYEAVGLADFKNDNAQAEASYRSSTQGMSDEAIRLELAQDKLRRSLQKGPAAYREQARAELQVRNSERALRGETDHLTSSLNRNQRELSQSARGALLGTGAFRSLGRSVAFASAGFLGGAGLVYGMRSAISAASNLEEQTNKTRVVFGEAGEETIAWSRTTATSIGIASDQALGYAGQIGAILNVTGLARKESANMSRDIVQLAADMASFNNEDPTEMLEALRSGLVGEAEPLRRRGVLLDEATVKQEAYRIGLAEVGAELSQGQKVQARYSLILKQTADQQGDYARTADSLANSQRTLSALWREANILVGTALAPAFTDAVQGLRDWLSVEDNQVELQRTVNQLVGDGEKVVRGFAAGLKLVKEAAEPVVDAVGGVGNAVEIATLLWVAFKVKALLGFGATAAASKATAASMVTDAVVAGRAWDVATRPRIMPVTVVGGGAPVPGAPGGGKGKIPFAIGWNLPTLAVSAVIASGGGGTQRGDRSGQYPHVYAAVTRASRGQASVEEVAILRQELGKYSLANAPDANMARAERRLTRIAPGGPGPETSGRRRGGRGGFQPPPETAAAGRDSTGKRPRRTLADIELDIARPGNELGDLREKRSFVQRQIDSLERRKNKSPKEIAQLTALYGQLASTQSAIESIIDEGEAKIEAQKEAAAAKRAAAIRERIDTREQTLVSAREQAELTERLSDDMKRQRNLIAFYKAQEHNDKLTAKERGAYRAKRIKARQDLAKLHDDAADRARDLKEQRLQNAKDAAELTKKLGDDKQAQRRLVAFYRQQAHDRDNTDKERLDYREKEIEARKELQATRGKDATEPFDAVGFLAGLQGTMNQFGGNLFAQGSLGGAPNPDMYSMVTELRQQTGILSGLASGVRQPGTKYARTELQAAFEGPTF